MSRINFKLGLFLFRTAFPTLIMRSSKLEYGWSSELGLRNSNKLMHVTGLYETLCRLKHNNLDYKNMSRPEPNVVLVELLLHKVYNVNNFVFNWLTCMYVLTHLHSLRLPYGMNMCTAASYMTTTFQINAN